MKNVKERKIRATKKMSYETGHKMAKIGTWLSIFVPGVGQIVTAVGLKAMNDRKCEGEMEEKTTDQLCNDLIEKTKNENVEEKNDGEES